MENEVKKKKKRRKKKPNNKKKKRITRAQRQKQLQQRLMIAKFVGVAILLIALITGIVFLVRGIVNSKSSDEEVIEEVEEGASELLEESVENDDVVEEEIKYVVSEEELAKAKLIAESTDALEEAWENTWLKQMDISGDNVNILSINECVIAPEDTSLVKVSGVLDGIPKADSDDLYLFALNTYETSIPAGAEPIDTYRIEKTDPTFSMYANLNHKSASTRLFKKFVVAAKLNGNYKILSTSRYITNPEAICKTNAYKTPSSKKGLIIDPLRMNSGELEDLGVKQGAYNIPLGYIMGGTTFAGRPTIYYEYGGKTYAFNGQAVSEFDMVFSTLSSKGIQVSVVILNNLNGAYPELIHPNARGTGSAPYYMFNGSDADGVNAMAAAATFLAERYSGAHGTVSNWIIANEIDARKEWNNYANVDCYSYTDAYAQGFRVFYNAIKSVNGSARVYMPLDQTWNRNLNNGDYDGRDILDNFNSIISAKGNIDWGLAHHPYPVPLTNAAFWNTGSFKKYTTNSVDTQMINMQNIHVVTNYLTQSSMLAPDGSVRSVLLSEVGFTSSSGGEGVQAAALAYAYYIAAANQHIDGLIINRQTDSYEEIAQGLAVGLVNAGGGRKQAYNVFKYMDAPNSHDVTDQYLGVIGADSWGSIVQSH